MFPILISILLLVSLNAEAFPDVRSSYFDVQGQTKAIKDHKEKYQEYLPKNIDCNELSFPSPEISYISLPNFYDDPKGYYSKSRGLRDLEITVSQLTGLYVSSGNKVFLGCLVRGLEKWAKANAMMKFSKGQAWVNIGWATSSIAMAYSVAKQASVDSPFIESWLVELTNRILKIKGGKKGCCNNLSNWRGLLAISVGLVTGNATLFENGQQRFKTAIEQMNSDGSFPLEMTRGKKSLHYQNFAILPLVYIAEISNRQGIDLYGFKSKGKSIHSAVSFLVSALKKPVLIEKYTLEKQDLLFSSKSTHLNWLEPYLKRRSIPYLSILRERYRPFYRSVGGGFSTLFFYRPVNH